MPAFCRRLPSPRYIWTFPLCTPFPILYQSQASLLVHPEEYEAVEQSIWEQVQQPNSDGNDAVRYRIITKSGQVKCILDKGRLVETDVYGKVFYVLMIDESNW